MRGAAARPQMVATLNSFRDTLEDHGGGIRIQAMPFCSASLRAYAFPKYPKPKRSSTVTAPTSSIASIAPMAHLRRLVRLTPIQVRGLTGKLGGYFITTLNAMTRDGASWQPQAA